MSFQVTDRAAEVLKSVLERYHADAFFVHVFKCEEGYRCVMYPGVPRSTNEYEVVLERDILFLVERRILARTAPLRLPFDLVVDLCGSSGDTLEIVASGAHPWNGAAFRTVSKEAFRV